MSLNDWILSLHLLSAVALVAAEVLFTIMIVATLALRQPLARRVDDARRAGSATVLVMIGMSGTIVFGVWLAISLDAYQLWDGWVIAALVLWALGGSLGQKSGEGYQAGGELAREARGRRDRRRARSWPRRSAPRGRSGSTTRRCVVVLLIVVDMIWKPGA